MKFYDVMQLNAFHTKELIKKTELKQEKYAYLAAFFLKNFLCVLFCALFVTAFTVLFGKENSITGVVVLISLLVFRFADLGMQVKHSVLALWLVFIILTIGPHLSAATAPVQGFLINLVCIFTIVFLSCHNMVMSNHTTLVLGYLLLQGYDVSGPAYARRAAGLLLGGLLISVIFYIKHQNRSYRRSLSNLFKEFRFHATRSRWQLKLSLCISSALLLGSLLHLPRPMWVGIACMSIYQPLSQDITYRLKRRAPFTVIGCMMFTILYLVFPPDMRMLIGMLGGFLAGFCAKYRWQTAFNCLGALMTAVDLYGLAGTILLRIFCNLFATGYGFLFDELFHKAENIASLMRTRQAAS